jgi:hypothetical protein
VYWAGSTPRATSSFAHAAASGTGAILAHASELRGERREERRRLARAAGKDEERIRPRTERVRRQHRDGQVDLPTLRGRAILGNSKRSALGGDRETRQPTFGERQRAASGVPIAAAGHGNETRGGEQGQRAYEGKTRHRGRW